MEYSEQEQKCKARVINIAPVATHAKWNTATISHILTFYDNCRGKGRGDNIHPSQVTRLLPPPPLSFRTVNFREFGFCFVLETKFVSVRAIT